MEGIEDVMIEWKTEDGEKKQVLLKVSTQKGILFKKTSVPIWTSSLHLGIAHTYLKEKKIKGPDIYTIHTYSKSKTHKGPTKAIDEYRLRFLCQWESGQGKNAHFTDILYDMENAVIIKDKLYPVYIRLKDIFTEEQLDPSPWKNKNNNTFDSSTKNKDVIEESSSSGEESNISAEKNEQDEPKSKKMKKKDKEGAIKKKKKGNEDEEEEEEVVEVIQE